MWGYVFHKYPSLFKRASVVKSMNFCTWIPSKCGSNTWYNVALTFPITVNSCRDRELCDQKHTTGGSASLQYMLSLGGERKCSHAVNREQLQCVRWPCSRWYGQVLGASSWKVRERSFLRKGFLSLALNAEIWVSQRKSRDTSGKSVPLSST